MLRTVFWAPALGLRLGSFILIWLFFVVARSLGCINHVYVVRRGGRPMSSEWRVLALLIVGIVVNTGDVFGAIVELVG